MRGTQFAQLTAFVTVAENCGFTRASMQLGISTTSPSQTIRSLQYPVAAKSSTDGIVANDAVAQPIHLATPGSSPPRRTGLAISGRPFPPGAGRSRLIPVPQIANADQRSAVTRL
jgi:hypothetical protein